MNPIPNSVEELIEELEENNPPTCKTPKESLEDHVRYAGRVDLVQELRLRLDWTRQNSRVTDIDPLKGI